MSLLPVIDPQPVMVVVPPSAVCVEIHGRKDATIASSPPGAGERRDAAAGADDGVSAGHDPTVPT